jgi:aminoglycoside 3-N-acetyltransferase
MQPTFTGTPMQLVQMLIDFCGPDRTLAMPAFFFGSPGTSGAFETFQRKPTFDLLRNPSQMGLATEIFRRTKGVSHSRHPVNRIIALGPLAKELTEGHETAGTPCGRGTPFDYMTRHETQILGIGKNIEVLTHVHHAEDLMGDAFPVPAIKRETPLQMTLKEGEKIIPFSMAGRSFEWQRNMLNLRTIMDPKTLKEWTFHHVPLFSVSAKDVTAALLAAAKRGVTIYQRP